MYEPPYYILTVISVFILGLAGLASLYLHSLICDLPSPSVWSQEQCRGIRNTMMQIRVPLFPLKRPDPDPTCHVFADPDPDPVPQVIQICDQRFTDRPRLRFEPSPPPLWASTAIHSCILSLESSWILTFWWNWSGSGFWVWCDSEWHRLRNAGQEGSL
jgi:hypothetical protein